MEKHLRLSSASDHQPAKLTGKEREPMNAAATERTEVTARITSKGQITLPAKFRHALGVREGDQVRFVLKDGVVYVEPVVYLDADQLFGMFKHPDGPHFTLDLNQAREERAAEILRGGD